MSKTKQNDPVQPLILHETLQLTVTYSMYIMTSERPSDEFVAEFPAHIPALGCDSNHRASRKFAPETTLT